MLDTDFTTKWQNLQPIDLINKPNYQLIREGFYDSENKSYILQLLAAGIVIFIIMVLR